MIQCNCVAPLAHHAKCTQEAADPSSLCVACQLCWEIHGPCCAPDVPDAPIAKLEPIVVEKDADVEAAINAAAEEAFGI